MELWIRSQYRELFRKSERLCIVKDLRRYYIADNGDIYGEYPTEKRALEVLDEIQNILIDYKEMSRVVYQIPQD